MPVSLQHTTTKVWNVEEYGDGRDGREESPVSGSMRFFPPALLRFRLTSPDCACTVLLLADTLIIATVHPPMSSDPVEGSRSADLSFPARFLRSPAFLPCCIAQHEEMKQSESTWATGASRLIGRSCVGSVGLCKLMGLSAGGARV